MTSMLYTLTYPGKDRRWNRCNSVAWPKWLTCAGPVVGERGIPGSKSGQDIMTFVLHSAFFHSSFPMKHKWVRGLLRDLYRVERSYLLHRRKKTTCHTNSQAEINQWPRLKTKKSELLIHYLPRNSGKKKRKCLFSKSICQARYQLITIKYLGNDIAFSAFIQILQGLQ